MTELLIERLLDFVYTKHGKCVGRFEFSCPIMQAMAEEVNWDAAGCLRRIRT